MDSRERLVQVEREKEANEKKAPVSATKPSKKRRKSRGDDEETGSSDDGEGAEDEEDWRALLMKVHNKGVDEAESGEDSGSGEEDADEEDTDDDVPWHPGMDI